MIHQSGITGIGVTDHAFVELDVKEGVEVGVAVGKLAAAINLPSTAGANVVIGVRPTTWSTVAPGEHVPADVHDFDEPIRGRDGYRMPATQHDAWLWVASSSRSQVFDVEQHILGQVAGLFDVADETIGWVYEMNRDLTGFEDGTENPGVLEAPGVVAVGPGKPGAGASVLLFQLWDHRTAKWEKLGAAAQEDVIGRTKADSIELDDDVKPESSHVARTVVEVDGEELDILRRNTAYGDVTAHGTVFVGFSQDQWRQEEMLRRMAGADGGPRDRLTEFTDALTGSWYVCPSVEGLLAVAGPYLDDED